jgi:DNA invertase Pin-like site-specific DNA recombinase
MVTTAPGPQQIRPAEAVPVAILARTSTLALQDPYASLSRQISSAREWLPDGFYVAGYYWDVESGGLDIEQRGHGTYGQLTARGLPRDGGLADLLAEAKAPQPRFAAVVVEDIERSARDTYNSLKLERQLADQGIPLFATDEPADITGISPTTILVRRIKQGVAEWFRLQLKEKAWKGLKEHTTEGWNLGPVPYGYLPDRVPHPNPFKAAQGDPGGLFATCRLMCSAATVLRATIWACGRSSPFPAAESGMSCACSLPPGRSRIRRSRLRSRRSTPVSGPGRWRCRSATG